MIKLTEDNFENKRREAAFKSLVLMVVGIAVILGLFLYISTIFAGTTSEVHESKTSKYLEEKGKVRSFSPGDIMYKDLTYLKFKGFTSENIIAINNNTYAVEEGSILKLSKDVTVLVKHVDFKGNNIKLMLLGKGDTKQ